MKTLCPHKLGKLLSDLHVCLCRNYHVFYYLLAGASEEERKAFHLKKPEEYHYLSQVGQKRDHNQPFHLDVVRLFFKSVPLSVRLCRQETEDI